MPDPVHGREPRLRASVPAAALSAGVNKRRLIFSGGSNKCLGLRVSYLVVQTVGTLKSAVRSNSTEQKCEIGHSLASMAEVPRRYSYYCHYDTCAVIGPTR